MTRVPMIPSDIRSGIFRDPVEPEESIDYDKMEFPPGNDHFRRLLCLLGQTSV